MTLPTAKMVGGSPSCYVNPPAKPWTKEGAGRVGVDQVGVSIRVLRVTDRPCSLLSPPPRAPPCLRRNVGSPEGDPTLV